MENGSLQTASKFVEQVSGKVDPSGLIKAIVKAAQTARRNKKTCRQLGESAQQIGDLLRGLQQQPGITMMQHPETNAALLQLRETLQTARELVESCGRGGFVRGLCASESRATRLQDVQSRITFFLQLFPIISHLDSTRLLVRVIGDAATSASSSPMGADVDVLRSLANHTQHGDWFQNLSFTEMMTATNEFSVDNLIEQGPLATLYKGQLHGKDVILKRHSVSSSGQQLPPCMSRYELFKNEVGIIPKLQHNNIVKLMGFCAERSERILVYEYMENGSLEDVIFVSPVEWPWPIRFRIIQKIAQGADYLHSHSRLRVIHRDLKPSNILLDSDMNPKISNFDLAKVLDPDKSDDTTDCVVGSIAFIAPEYMKEGTFSVHTDVYSFGVMVLEIISRKRWTKQLQETYYKSLRTWAFNGSLRCGAKVKSNLKIFVDPSLHSILFCGSALPRCLSFPARRKALMQLKEIRRCVQVALLCIQVNPKRRLGMVNVVGMLSHGKARVPFPHRPGYAQESPLYASCMTL